MIEPIDERPLDIRIAGSGGVTYILLPNTLPGVFDDVPLGELMVMQARVAHVAGMLSHAIDRALRVEGQRP